MIFGAGFSSRWMDIPRQIVPALITTLLLVAQILPWSRTADAMIPSFVLMSVFFWSLRAPGLCPPLFACLIGALADLTQLTPLGSQAILFLIVAIGLGRRARFGDLSFLRLWVLFAALCLAVNIALWLIELVIGGHIMPLGQAFERTAIACLLYPILAKVIFMPVERLVKANG